MRVPTRENRYFLAPSPDVGLRRRDDRIPSLATPQSDAQQRRELVDAYAEIRRNDKLESEQDRAGVFGTTGDELISTRFSSLLQESLWDRVLKKHGLADD